MREHLITNIRKIAIEIINRIFNLKSKKIVYINGAGAEIRTRVPGSTVPEDDRLPYPGIYKILNKKNC